MICLLLAAYCAVHESRCKIFTSYCRRCDNPETFQFAGILVDIFGEFVLLGLLWRLA